MTDDSTQPDRPVPGRSDAEELVPDPTNPDFSNAIGLGDRYEVGGLLGRGGMADVRVGRDLRLGRTVAIKLLRADLAADETFQERFRREAQSAASLNHPAIVAVYDTGEHTDEHGNQIPYIVMELVEGRTLRDILREGRKILPERAIAITADILSALDYSHRAGIIHRDIKPANVMLTPDGKVKVMDFGIARAIADTSAAMTQTAAVIGTAQYLSPEQARGETVDARSDIYSTGCVMYELLTGRPPFVGDSPVSVAYQHVREEARPPSQLNPDVSIAIDHVAAKALAKRVDDRYSSAADMRRDLERVNAGHHVDAPTQMTAVVPMATPAPTQVHAAAPAAAAAPAESSSGGSGKTWAIIALIIALLAAIGFVLWLGMDEEEPPAELVTIPSLTGQSQENATLRLERLGLEVGDVQTRVSDEVPEGQVIDTNPPSGSRVDEGSSVDLIISSGVEQVTIPNLDGYSFENAQRMLEGEDYQLKVQREDVDDTARAGRVINSTPPAGTRVDVGSEITLIVSRGQVTVPNFEGATQSEAQAAAGESDLEVTFTESPSATVPAGQVISQSRAPGTQVAPGTSIELTISTGPEIPEEPPIEEPPPEEP